MVEINIIKDVKCLISVRVPLETIPTNGKLKFDNKNYDSTTNYSNRSGISYDNNNEQKYNYDNDHNDDDKNNSNNNMIKKFLKIIIIMIVSYD